MWEKWNPSHTCSTVSVNAMEEGRQLLSEDNSSHPSQEFEESNSGDDLMALSSQALNGTEGSKTIRLRGFISGQEAFMLVDSGSSHCFINEKLAS